MRLTDCKKDLQELAENSRSEAIKLKAERALSVLLSKQDH
jgi:hypothetical protein